MRTIFMFLISCVFFSANAQEKIIDSLERLLLAGKADTNQVKLFDELGQAFHYTHPDSQYYYQYKGKLLANNLHFLHGELECLIGMGYGLIYMGNYNKALETQFEALGFCEEHNFPQSIDKVLTNIGVIYAYEGDFRKSLEYNFKAKPMYEQANDNEGEETTLENLGDIYEKLNMLDSALYFTNLAYEKSIAMKDEDGIGIGLNNLGNVHSKLNNDRLALDYYRLSLPYYQNESDYDGLCESTLGLASVFLKQSHTDSAIFYALQSLSIARSGAMNQRVLNACEFLANYYKQAHISDSSLKYLELTVAYKDSLFNQEKIKNLQNLTFDEKMREQEIEEQKLKDEEASRKNIQLAGIAVFIPTFFLFIIFLSHRKVKSGTIEFLGILALLLVFEFVTLFLHPYIARLTNETPVLMLLLLVAIAAILVPLHHRLEHWVKQKLVHKHIATNTASIAQ